MDPEKHDLFEIKATKRRGEERLTQRTHVRLRNLHA
jgi:hypothetical protein